MGDSPTNLLGVERADDKVLQIGAVITLIVVRLVLIIILVADGGLALGLAGLDTVGLGVLHLLVIIAAGGLEELLDSSGLLLLLRLGGVAGPAIRLIVTVLLVIITSTTEHGHQVLLAQLVILIVVEAGVGTLDQAESGSRDGRNVAVLVSLGLLGGIDCGHGDAELREPLLVARRLERAAHNVRAQRRAAKSRATLSVECGQTHRSREVHGGRDQDLAGRDLEPVDRTRNSRHGAGNVKRVIEIVRIVECRGLGGGNSYCARGVV